VAIGCAVAVCTDALVKIEAFHSAEQAIFVAAGPLAAVVRQVSLGSDEFRPAIAYRLVGALGAEPRYSLIHWQTQDWTQICVLFARCADCIAHEVRLPGVTGPMSNEFSVRAGGVAELSLAETMLMAVSRCCAMPD